MGNASLDGIDWGGASLDGEFPIRPICLIRLIRPISPHWPYLCAINKKRRPFGRLKFCSKSGGQDCHRYARPSSFTIISKRNVMHHYVSVFLAISVLQVNMHTLITKKKTRNCESCITLRLMRRALDSKCRAFTPKLAGIQNKKKRRPLGRAINRSTIPATSLKWESVATRKISSSLAIFLLCGRVELALISITQQKKDDHLVVWNFAQKAEGTGFEPADTLRYRQFSKLLV